ncbi:MAG: hypothetical protein ABR615_01900 [Pseudonocardiaceae bacterium]
MSVSQYEVLRDVAERCGGWPGAGVRSEFWRATDLVSRGIAVALADDQVRESD